MSEQELAEIEQRANAATRGEWQATRDGEWQVTQSDSDHYEVICRFMDGTPTQQENDSDFIAHARQDIPALIAEIKRLRKARF